MYPALVAWFREGPLPWLAYLVPRPGLLYAVTVLACGTLFTRRATRSALTVDMALEALLAAMLGALVGTRLFYLVTRTRFWELGFTELLNWSRGTASWGAYLGATLGLSGYALWRKLRPLRLIDIGTSVAGLGDAIGRVNCWITGDDFGRVTVWPWGIRYPQGSMAWSAHLKRGLVQSADPWSLPVHPNTLLMAVTAFLVFLVTSWYWQRHRDQVGRTTALFCLLYGAQRFVVEFLRDPDAGGASGPLSHSQYMCIVLVATGGFLWWRTLRPGPSASPRRA